MLEIKATTRLVIGVQCTESGCLAVLADLRAGKIASAHATLAGTSPDAVVDSVERAVGELRSRATAPILGVGVGIPGLVEPTGRDVIASVPYGWDHVPIAEMLEARFALPVVVTNRAKAAALGEYWQGGHVGTPQGRHLAYLHVGAGIVAGYVIDGRLFHGSAGAAGEIGHITILPDGPACGCGNSGCLHTLASESAIVRSVKTRLRHHEGDNSLGLGTPQSLTIASLVAHAREGNPLVLEAVTEAGTYLGSAIAMVLNLMNPSTIVIGGSVAGFGDPLIAAIRAQARQRALWETLAGVPIVASHLGADAGPLGAAALYLDRLEMASLLAGS